MTERKSYRVVVTREHGHWLADVPDLAGAHTFARTLSSLDKAVREVIVLAADLPDEDMGSLRLVWDYRTGDATLDEEAAQVRALRAEAEQLAERAGASTVAMARLLVARGMSVRDVAVLLGISPQRVSQMTGHARAS
jgi:predicted RNase H-like HicB family nuclease